MRYSVVIPTIGRPSLIELLEALADAEGPQPDEVFVVDDRPAGSPRIRIDAFGLPVRVLTSGGRGPAAARNVGWRAATSPWVAFLDDDVIVGRRWRDEIVSDLAGLPWLVAGSQGRLRVPLRDDRKPTDWERNVAGLASARWITADLAYRRQVLREVGGFDERFPRAFREDADLALRVGDAGYLIVQGERHADHPVRPTDRWISVRLQAGNADDVLMRSRHGAGWRVAAGAGTGRNGRHLLTTAALGAAAASFAAGKRRAAAVAAAAWLAGTVELAAARIRPGPQTRGEVTTMAVTSAVIPVAAVFHQSGDGGPFRG
jgi:glycosyltransferase involved in cell wall biosynthesis